MTESCNADELARALEANDGLCAALADVISLAQAIRAALSAPLEDPIKQPFNAAFTREDVLAEHRRAHRSGRPAKIEGDPELQAFILARIETMTFAQIVSEVRATFPPDRQCSMSGLGRWWLKHKSR